MMRRSLPSRTLEFSVGLWEATEIKEAKSLQIVTSAMKEKHRIQSEK